MIILKFIFNLFSRKKEIRGRIKCTGNNGNGCYMDSCGHNCGCEGITN